MKEVIFKKTWAVVLVLLLLSGVAYAAEDRGNAQEAKAIVKKAVEYLKANGRAKAIAEFNNPQSAFVQKDLYVFAFDMQGITMAHVKTPSLVGRNVSALKDADQKLFIQDIIGMAKSAGSGWVDYRWTDPKTKKIEPKSTYFEKHDDLVILCGFYK
jgi:signal transduction histidine kinase